MRKSKKKVDAGGKKIKKRGVRKGQQVSQNPLSFLFFLIVFFSSRVSRKERQKKEKHPGVPMAMDENVWLVSWSKWGKKKKQLRKDFLTLKK